MYPRNGFATIRLASAREARAMFKHAQWINLRVGGGEVMRRKGQETHRARI